MPAAVWCRRAPAADASRNACAASIAGSDHKIRSQDQISDQEQTPDREKAVSTPPGAAGLHPSRLPCDTATRDTGTSRINPAKKRKKKHSKQVEQTSATNKCNKQAQAQAQAASCKLQAASCKLQAARCKVQGARCKVQGAREKQTWGFFSENGVFSEKWCPGEDSNFHILSDTST